MTNIVKLIGTSSCCFVLAASLANAAELRLSDDELDSLTAGAERPLFEPTFGGDSDLGSPSGPTFSGGLFVDVPPISEPTPDPDPDPEPTPEPAPSPIANINSQLSSLINQLLGGLGRQF